MKTRSPSECCLSILIFNLSSSYFIKIDSGNNNQKRYTYDACKSRPCSAGSYCESLNNAKFICYCPLGKHGTLCDKNLNLIMFPSFKSNSFLEFTSTEISMNDLNIDIEFKSTKLNGILLFLSQSSDGLGDFITVLLRSGFIEMRYIFKRDLYYFF